MKLTKIFLCALFLLWSFSCASADMVYEAAYDGTALRAAPGTEAKVIDRARKGWKLHASGSDSSSEWVEIYEIDSGEGPWYVYRMYGLPGENVFVRRSDLKTYPDSAPVPKKILLEQSDSLLGGLVHLKVKGTNVRLRKGPGTAHPITGQVSSGGLVGELIAWKETIRGKDGKSWYRVLYRLERQEETAYVEVDEYVCADFAKATPLTEVDRERIENDKFRMLHISPQGLPAFSFSEPLRLLGDPFDDASAVTVAPGTSLVLFTIPYNMTGRKSRVELWEPVDSARIRRLGSMELGDLASRSGYAGEMTVREWLEKQKGGHFVY